MDKGYTPDWNKDDLTKCAKYDNAVKAGTMDLQNHRDKLNQFLSLFVKISKIRYSSQFDAFLDSLNDKTRADQITTALENYAKDPNELPRPKDCKHYANREKVAIPDANVVVFYDNFGSYWVMIDGSEFVQRVS